MALAGSIIAGISRGVELCSALCLQCWVSTWAELLMREACARSGQVHMIVHPNTHAQCRAHGPTQKNKHCVSRSSKQRVSHIGFSYYFQRGQFWSPPHVYIGVVSSLISTDTFPILFPVRKINRISNCLVLPHQRENMIYEMSSHEKPILRDYLLITETAQLTDKGKRGDLCWMRNTMYVWGEGGRVWPAYYFIMWLCAPSKPTEKPKKDICLSSTKTGPLSNQALLHSFPFRSQGTKQFLLISILLLCFHQEAAAHSIAIEIPIHQSFMTRQRLITDIEIFNCL